MGSKSLVVLPQLINQPVTGHSMSICSILLLYSKDPASRPTAQLLTLIKYFSDPAVHALQFLDVINMKDVSQKTNFYRVTLKDHLLYIPRVSNGATLETPSPPSH